MEDVLETPPDAKRGQKKLKVMSSFFVDKVRTLLMRTRGAMQAFPGGTEDVSFAVMDNVDSFIDATSLEDVVNKLGQDSLATKVFLSVTDEDEKRQLQCFEDKGQPGETVIKEEFERLLARAQSLARELPESVLIAQVLALPIETVSVEKESGDESGTGEEEEEEEVEEVDKSDDEKKAKSSNKRARSKRKASERKSSKPQKTKKKEDKIKQKVKKGEAPDEGKEEEEGEEQVLMEGEEKQHSSSLCIREVHQLLLEAEEEFETIRTWQSFSAVARVEAGRLEEPPNVRELIEGMHLVDVDCLCEMDRVALNSAEGRVIVQMWWRIAKRACKIRGLFVRIRAQKSKAATIQERYATIVAGIEGRIVLSFAQASRYERLGKFLEEFPLFVFQRKWVTLADWFHKVDNGAVLVDCLASLVPVSSVFLRDSFTLHEHGFQVYPGMMKDSISEEMIRCCKTGTTEAGEIVFNNSKKVNSRQNDGNRMQLDLEKVGDGAVAQFKVALTDRLSALYPRHKVDSMVALLSKSWCKAQLAHTDYSPDTLANVLGQDENMPLACLVALTDDTVFDVWPHAIRFDSKRKLKSMQIRLRAGDVLIFRADLVHGGAAVGEVENVRIHAYLDVGGVVRPQHDEGVEETFFMCDEKYILKRP